MLVLSRKKEEEILIGAKGEIIIRVLEIRGGVVRLGITADKSVPVHRREIFESIERGESPKPKKRADGSPDRRYGD